MGHGGSAVGSVPCVDKVAGSNPALVAMLGFRVSPSLVVACTSNTVSML